MAIHLQDYSQKNQAKRRHELLRIETPAVMVTVHLPSGRNDVGEKRALLLVFSTFNTLPDYGRRVNYSFSEKAGYGLRSGLCGGLS